MRIKTLTVGPLKTNCYLLIDDQTQQTIIVDPADEADFITTTLIEDRLTPTAILLTHGHYDHCLGTLELQLNFNIPIHLHKSDYPLYQKDHLSAKHFSNIKIPPLPKANNLLDNNQIILFGNSSLKVIHTPGHTPGSCCFISVCHSGLDPESSPKSLFTGDTLFATGPGKADHSYSSKSDLQKSLDKLRSEIRNLKSVIIYPGHEEWGFIALPSLF